MAIDTLLRRIPELSAVLLSIIFAVVYALTGSERDSRTQAAHTIEVQSALHDYEAAIISAESGQRGFLMSSNENYLKGYTKALEELPELIDKVRALVADNARQSAEAASLASDSKARLERLAITIAARRRGDEQTVQNIYATHPGQNIMTKIRETLTRMIANEQTLYAERTKTAERASYFLRLSIALGILAIAAALSFWIYHSRKQQSELSKANIALREALSENKSSAEKVRQLQKMEAVGQLTGGIAHDFNNMLAVITGALNLVQKRMSQGNTDIGSLVDAALDGAARATNLTRRLLAFSRQQPLAPTVLNANAVVQGMAEILSRAIGESVQTETTLGAGLWTINTDQSALENALINLCVNARDAMPDGGKITIETANFYIDDTYAREHVEVNAGQYVLIAVTDTGSGMSPAVIEKAFDPFFTTKEVGKGTGLGLSQVHGFVKQSGGHIKIYSEPGHGTTVEMYFPRSLKFETATIEKSDFTPLSGNNELILLVEDDSRVREMSTNMVKDLGYRVVSVDSAKAALQLLEARSEIAPLFTDIVMPEVNGRKLADAAKALRPDLKVLFTTGFTRNAIVHNGVLDTGVNLLPKPFTLEQLAVKLRAVLSQT